MGDWKEPFEKYERPLRSVPPRSWPHDASGFCGCYSCFVGTPPAREAKAETPESPGHYKYGSGVQAIDIIHQIFSVNDGKIAPFTACMVYNVFKYLLRFWRKNGVEDLEKAQVYLKWTLENIKTGNITHE